MNVYTHISTEITGDDICPLRSLEILICPPDSDSVFQGEPLVESCLSNHRCSSNMANYVANYVVYQHNYSNRILVSIIHAAS